MEVITIMKDGNAWLCHDETFVDLAESDNFDWGGTPLETLEVFLEVNPQPE